jgi:LmbE family N-acetylglucosaminyl deacetylase
MSRTIVVVAPHKDDETLGAGGTIARRVGEGDRIHVVTVTKGCPPLYAEETEARCRREAEEAHRRLGVHESHWLSLPAAELDSVPHRILNERLAAVLDEIDPDEIYIPFLGDVHGDHRAVFDAALVAVRPHRGRFPAEVYAYETLSETNWNAPYLTPGFHPTHFVDISAHLEAKLDALRCFASQMRSSPHERSIETARALAVLRGATIGVPAAEAFVTIRTVARARPAHQRSEVTPVAK